MAHLQVDVAESIFRSLIEQSAIENVAIAEAVNTALWEWCENRAYLRSGREERRTLNWKLGKAATVGSGE